MADNSELMTAIQDAIIETAKRPAGLRGPYVFDEADLQAMAAAIAARRTPVTAEAGEVSDAEVSAALAEDRRWDEGFTSAPRRYFVYRRDDDDCEWSKIAEHADRAPMEEDLRRRRMVAALLAARRVQPKQDAPSPDVAGLVEADYFASLVIQARLVAARASAKFPQPNYVTLKIAEEAGEVVRGAVHYAEGRMEWSEVEGEIVQLLAMLMRFVTEGDQINGVTPPAALSRLAPPKQDGARDSTVGAQAIGYMRPEDVPVSGKRNAFWVSFDKSAYYREPLYTAASLASARADALKEAGDALVYAWTQDMSLPEALAAIHALINKNAGGDRG